MIVASRRAAIVLVALVTQAHADEVDPSVVDADEKNLESVARRGWAR